MDAQTIFSNLKMILLGAGAIFAFVGLLRIYKKWLDENGFNIDIDIIRWLGGALLCLLSYSIASLIWG